MGLALVTAPTTEPVSLAEARAQCRIDLPEEDGLTAGYLLAAREYVETYTRRALLTQTWDLTVDDWGREILLPKPPVQSVTSVQYLDSAGAQQTLDASSYRLVRRDTGQSAVVCASGATWPPLASEEAAVTVRFVAGYGHLPGSIPEAMRLAILLLVDHWHENRAATNGGSGVNELPYAVAALLFPYRVFY